jgi:short-subunit dehydrogenase
MPLAVITGGTSGIGFQIARRLRDRGYELFIQGLVDEHLKKAKQCLNKESKSSTRPLPPVTFLGLDLSPPEAPNELTQAVMHHADHSGNPPDMLINCAGLGLYGEHTTLPESRVTAMLQVNVMALSHLCQSFGRYFCTEQRGYILNIASTTAFQPLPFLAAYASSKAYVKQFSLALAQEFEKYGVTVCCVCPGATNTPFLQHTGLHEAKRYRLGNVLNHFAMDPSAVADAALSGLFSGKNLITPGLINKSHYRASRHVPEPFASMLGKIFLRPKTG